MFHCCLVLLLFITALPLQISAQKRYDVLITEILADASPPVGLPSATFIELTNHSTSDWNLYHWKITSRSGSSTIKTDFILKADSIVILCSTAAADGYRAFGTALGLTAFPSLAAEAGDIILTSQDSQVIHAVHYEKDWLGNELKMTGGWSLEMMDPDNCCGGKLNWTASLSGKGGTPGQINSVYGLQPDKEPPSVVRSVTTDSLNLVLRFDEPLDSLTASNADNYNVSDNIGSPENALALPPFFDQVSLRLKKPLIAGNVYTVSVSAVTDVTGNEISSLNNCKAGVAETPDAANIIFNEVLFNPPSFGYDYIEIFNRSAKIVDVSKLLLAGREQSGSLKDPIHITSETSELFPGEYRVLTENAPWLLETYPQCKSEQVIQMDIPSMPDDLGQLVLLSPRGGIIDELDYDHHWHSPLLADESGIALERIDANLPTSIATNWASAASAVSSGTPGYKNSEASVNAQTRSAISIEPKIFSPDYDGHDDFCFIHYEFTQPGLSGSVLIYNVYGTMVRKLVNNIIWSSSGTFRWDGLDDKNQLLPMGQYIIYTEVFSLDGRVRQQKLVCVLAR